jgi:sugar phosphate isomerase/epimerase
VARPRLLLIVPLLPFVDRHPGAASMSKPTRREVIALAPLAMAGAWASARTLSAQTAFPARLGVQLYTVRDSLGTLDATLKTLAEIGFTELETLRPVLAALPPLLKAHGLSAPSGHFDTPLVTGNAELWSKLAGPLPAGYSIEKAIEQAKTVGMKYMVLAYLLPQERQSIDDYKRYADRMNEVGRTCKAAGLQFAYHHHSFEFVTMNGERPWDVLLARCDKDLVALEVDVFWLAAAGLDPAATIRQLGSRVKLVHLKDRAKDAPVALDESKVPPAAFKEVGSGGLDFPAILKACRDAGVQHYFVEQDHTPGPPPESLRKSVAYLRSVKL